MDHDKMTRDFIDSQTAGWIDEDAPLIEKNCYANKSAIAEKLAASMAQVLTQAQLLAEKGQKGAAAYLCISFLYTNTIENIWQYRLDVYDETFVFDKTECAGEWEADFAFDYFQARLKNLGELLNSGIYASKVRPHHLNSVKMSVGIKYHVVATLLLKNIIQDVVNILGNKHSVKIPSLKIMMGEYKDLNLMLYDAAECLDD